MAAVEDYKEVEVDQLSSFFKWVLPQIVDEYGPGSFSNGNRHTVFEMDRPVNSLLSHLHIDMHVFLGKPFESKQKIFSYIFSTKNVPFTSSVFFPQNHVKKRKLEL